MYSELKKIEIIMSNPSHIYVEMNDGMKISLDIDDPKFKEFQPGEFMSTDGCAIIHSDSWIYIYAPQLSDDINSDLMVEIYAPYEFKKNVRKAAKKDRPFTLDYYKHLRSWFDRNRMLIYCTPGYHDWWSKDPVENTRKVRKAIGWTKVHSHGIKNRPLLILSYWKEKLYATVFKNDQLMINMEVN